jgi:hypothetical protein
MSFQVIVISQNQAKYIKDMVSAISLSFPGVPSLFVVDRSVDDSLTVLKSLAQPYIFNSKGEGFLAGRARDLGLSHLGIDNTLFLDGDRIPVGFSSSIIEHALSTYDITLASTANDFRKSFRQEMMVNPNFGKFHNDVFSCGLLIRKEMINQILKIQSGRLFHPVFDGAFGEEDRYLGDLVYSMGGTCGLFPGVLHLMGNSFSKINKSNYQVYKDQIAKRKLLRKGLGLYG